MSSYYNRPIVLHVEALCHGVWEAAIDSERGSVEAAVAFAESEFKDAHGYVFPWRVVDAGGNVHEQGGDIVQHVPDIVGPEYAADFKTVNERAMLSVADQTALYGEVYIAIDSEESIHIRASERRRLLEAALHEEGFSTIEELLERRA